MAMIAAPTGPKMALSAAVATRPSGAFWICAKGSVHKYARFARQYKTITIVVPKAIDSATSRLGFLTSPAVNAILFQASAEKSDPTCATPNATKIPKNPLATVTLGMSPRRKFAPGSMACASRAAQKCAKLSAMAA